MLSKSRYTATRSASASVMYSVSTIGNTQSDWAPVPALGVEKPQLEGVRDLGDRGLSAHAVAGLVQRRREGGDRQLARRHRDQAASNAALGGQPDGVGPVTRTGVEAL